MWRRFIYGIHQVVAGVVGNRPSRDLLRDSAALTQEGNMRTRLILGYLYAAAYTAYPLTTRAKTMPIRRSPPENITKCADIHGATGS